MWLMIAVACSSLEVTDCIPMVWKQQTYDTEQSCIAAITFVESLPPPGATYLKARCVLTPRDAI